LNFKQLFLGTTQEELENIWKERSDECPLDYQPLQFNFDVNFQGISEDFILNKYIKQDKPSTFDICFIYSPLNEIEITK
jgi:hypothetical protein